HNPPDPRNVARPLSAEMPAPLNTKSRSCAPKRISDYHRSRDARRPSGYQSYVSSELMLVFELRDLILIELVANLDLIMQGRLPEVRTRLFDAINLCEQSSLVQRLRVCHRFHALLFLLEALVALEQHGAVLLEDRVHVPLLIVGEFQLLGKVLIVPPTAGRTYVQPAVHSA